MKAPIVMICPFLSPSSGYSVWNVLRLQVRLLVQNRHNVTVVIPKDSAISAEDFGAHPVTIRRMNLPADDNWQGDPSAIQKELSQVFGEAQSRIGITHDAVLLDYFSKLCAGLAMLADSANPPFWLHMIHSRPSMGSCGERSNVQRDLLERSLIIYPNQYDSNLVAEYYGKPVADVRLVRNFIDPVEWLGLHPDVAAFYIRERLYEADVLITFPTRISAAKQLDELLHFVAVLRSFKKDVRLFVCDAIRARAVEQETQYRNDLRKLALALDLPPQALYFTSEVFPHAQTYCGVSTEVVRGLFQLSDTFVLTSAAEVAPLSLLEAALSRCFCVLNEDIPALKEVGGAPIEESESLGAVYLRFGSTHFPIKEREPDDETYRLEQARCFFELFQQDKVTTIFRHVRKYHAPQWVYENFLMPLIEEAEMRSHRSK